MNKKRSAEIEEYLETMVRYKEMKEPATVSHMAKELKISKASVSEMLRKLASAGFVKCNRYKAPSLTRRGTVAGFAVLHKHRLVQKFLTLIGMGKSKAHQEACALEHAVSDEVERRLRNVISNIRHIPLTTLGNGVMARVARIDATTRTSQRLADMGLTKGTRITLIKSAPLKGPVKIAVRGTTLALGRAVAAKILVKVG